MENKIWWIIFPLRNINVKEVITFYSYSINIHKTFSQDFQRNVSVLRVKAFYQRVERLHPPCCTPPAQNPRATVCREGEVKNENKKLILYLTSISWIQFMRVRNSIYLYMYTRF